VSHGKLDLQLPPHLQMKDRAVFGQSAVRNYRVEESSGPPCSMRQGLQSSLFVVVPNTKAKCQ